MQAMAAVVLSRLPGDAAFIGCWPTAVPFLFASCRDDETVTINNARVGESRILRPIAFAK